ncbi:Cbb3-type cytochrome c oxidase subunit [Neorhizobium galegae bv. officinalis bv. officinalis str. HAMBI 1141]|uniref:Cbb3-type cytochrome c oxidase subunit n=1 Tax=Neorhizobium galegae bv. officinalis bv. officinalis str. HAMBI 1141 TaxID=1028801 RepID=A0A068TE86_NEOGA|nr:MULTISPECIES: cytochrome-c oxidase, cbb3-type subunit III [Neorhizobium]MCJ9672537.1 cytochrome-c oxidase, cbb3-type subunit III [Neorhizobium sp. SHOUNA12B]MCJ9743568.1 cytochrome-c oxidase, cbb3-type subunit III [Neorhizobium sp. SHOUNA12A]CDN56399.1 Cbb3-type cytochrome c oxidase subunit [Neorhizobium galegae bv. officinalis bv. officinalis str. HAMBI 1141]
MAEKHIDELSGIETTGHEWDGIRELNNPLPRWWLWTFYACILWAIGYAIAYPSIPLLTNATKGLLGYSSRAEFAADLNGAKIAQGGILEKISTSSLEDIVADPQLNQFATAGGAAAFRVNCTPCHGTGATGGRGYPNLNDDDWLWGGDINALYQTIAHGIRDPADGETRISEMPAFTDMLKQDEVRQVAAYVVSLTGTPRDPSMVEPGKQLFADNCVACHGEKAEGKRDLGAPSLADAIWLKVHGEAEIARQIQTPKHGVMPAWQGRLGDVAVKQLTVYIHSLGGGE